MSVGRLDGVRVGSSLGDMVNVGCTDEVGTVDREGARDTVGLSVTSSMQIVKPTLILGPPISNVNFVNLVTGTLLNPVTASSPVLVKLVVSPVTVFSIMRKSSLMWKSPCVLTVAAAVKPNSQPALG